MPSASVPATAKQACDTRDPRQWGWVEPTVWSERMLAALVNGVTGGKWYSLWDKVSDRQTLEASWRAVARNQGAAGVDGQSVQRFAAQAERYLDELAADLQAGRYQPNDVRRTYIPKAGGGQRPLGIPTFITNCTGHSAVFGMGHDHASLSSPARAAPRSPQDAPRRRH